MTFTVTGSKIFAEVDFGSIVGIHLAGSYALDLQIDLHPVGLQGVWLTGLTSNVSLVDEGPNPLDLGIAVPSKPCVVSGSSGKSYITLRLPLEPVQVEHIEERRVGKGLRLQHLFWYSGLEREVDSAAPFGPFMVRSHQTVEQSAWLRVLDQMRYSVVALAELPHEWGSEPSAMAIRTLRDAEAHFKRGHYRECVAGCRALLKFARTPEWDTNDWSWDILQDGPSRMGMSKVEREQAIWQLAHHYASLANHPEDLDADYSRREARMMLTLAFGFIGSGQERG